MVGAGSPRSLKRPGGARGPGQSAELLPAGGLGEDGRYPAPQRVERLGAERGPLRQPGWSSCGEGSPGSCPLSRQPAQEVGRCLAEEGTPRSCHGFLCLGT